MRIPFGQFIIDKIRFIIYKTVKYTREALVRRRARVCGKNLYVGGKTVITGNTFIGDDCCFNGMTVLGGGMSSLVIISIRELNV